MSISGGVVTVVKIKLPFLIHYLTESFTVTSLRSELVFLYLIFVTFRPLLVIGISLFERSRGVKDGLRIQVVSRTLSERVKM